MFTSYAPKHIKRNTNATMCGYTFAKHPNRNFPLPTGRYWEATCRTCTHAFEELAKVLILDDILEVAMMEEF